MLADVVACCCLDAFLLALCTCHCFAGGASRADPARIAGLAGLLIDLPVYVFALAARATGVRTSWAFHLFWSFVFKPAVVCTLLWFWCHRHFRTWLSPVDPVQHVLADQHRDEYPMVKAVDRGGDAGAGELVRMLRAGLLPGLLRLLVWVFKRTIDMTGVCAA